MSAGPIRVTRTYLEMTSPSQLRRPRTGEPTGVRIERMHGCAPAFWRFLYTEVGRPYHWVDRLPWTDAEIAAYLGDPAVSLWLMSVNGAPAGYFELRRDAEQAVELVYFGLLDVFQGRGLGGYMLAQAVDRAWMDGASRVWLHT